MKWFPFLVLFLASSQFANAQQAWQIKPIDSNSVSLDIVVDQRIPAIDGLPDGRVTVGGKGASISKTWYTRPTLRYDHGILGDNIEAGALIAIDSKGKRHEVVLPETEVFEDITPRLVDLDGDGTTEIITIQSSISKGASLSIYQITTRGLVRVAYSPYIGLSHRWLNIAGIDHYSGNKSKEIAIVVTPHIGGRLDLYAFSRGKLYKLMSEQGFSNHFIGSNEQRLSASFPSDIAGKINLALPSADRRSLMIMSAGATGWVQTGIASLPSPINRAIGVSGKGNKAKFTLGLANGSVYSVFK